MSSDPHDDLLLTNRPTTIVTQATSGADTMPSPYGTQEDEEALFAQVGDDNGIARNALASDLASDGTAARIPGVANENQIVGVAPAPASAGTSIALVVGLGLLAGFLFARK